MSKQQLNKLQLTDSRWTIDSNSKYVFISDCHRGIGDYRDMYSLSEGVFLHALNYYNVNEYTYVEVGDSDELWGNDNIIEIMDAHPKTFNLLKEFYDQQRLIMVYGNHDYVKKNAKFIKGSNRKDIQDIIEMYSQLDFYEGIILELENHQENFLVVHGHQLDVFNNKFMGISAWAVRHIWSNLEKKGYVEPGATDIDKIRHKRAGKNLARWCAKQRQPLICGHTHRPAFSYKGNIPYYNSGCCVHPGIVTAIEITGGTIALVKWQKILHRGLLQVEKFILEGPISFQDLFKEDEEKQDL